MGTHGSSRVGTETGPAIADVLFGKASPSARLPVSFPYASEQEPYYYDHKPTGRPNGPGPLAEYKARWREAPMPLASPSAMA